MSNYIKISEVAKQLNIARSTAWRMVVTGTIPAVSIGIGDGHKKSFRVSRDGFEAWLQSRQIGAQGENVAV